MERKTVQDLREEKIQKVIELSKDSFFREEEKRRLSYSAFLYGQFRLIQKRWWLFQGIVLAALWIFLEIGGNTGYVSKSMGIAAALFVILLIPELWKNRRNQCMEIEAATYYSLKQVYSARMLLFGIADVFAVTVFCSCASYSLQISLTDLLIQFLFPMTVASCICFGILCNRRALNENFAVIMCLLWCFVWWYILLKESVYTRITEEIWIGLLALALVILAFLIDRSIKNCTMLGR